MTRPRDRIDKLIRRMWTAFIALAAVMALVGWLWVHDVTTRVQTSNREANQRIERAELAICKRVQRIRMNANRNSAVLYQGIWVFGNTSGVPSGVRRQLTVLVDVPQYQKPTDCAQAVAHPESYRPSPSLPVSSLSLARRRELLRVGR